MYQLSELLQISDMISMSVISSLLNSLHGLIKRVIPQPTSFQLSVLPLSDASFALCYTIYGTQTYCIGALKSSSCAFLVPFLQYIRRREVQYNLDTNRSDTLDISVVMCFGSDHLFKTIFLLPPLHFNLTGSEIA